MDNIKLYDHCTEEVNVNCIALVFFQVLSDWFIVVKCTLCVDSYTQRGCVFGAEVVHCYTYRIVVMPTLHYLCRPICCDHPQEPFSFFQSHDPSDTDCI